MIKSNREFISVLKNKNFNGREIEYKNILYLFDEVDTELDKILNKDKINININEKNTKNKRIIDDLEKEIDFKSSILDMKNTIESDQLGLGVLLEEMNGINQMFGRKMILITNNFDKLKNIHNGALIRPGRVDKIIEFKRLINKDAIKLIYIFFPDIKNLEDYIGKIDLNNKFTAAELSNICKISSDIHQLCLNLNNKKN